MATAASFDVTSTVDLQEVDNALNQTRKEVAQRYDLKGARTEIAFSPTEKTLVLTAEDRMQVEALWDEAQAVLEPPSGLDFIAYREALMRRFANAAIEHRTAQIS